MNKKVKNAFNLLFIMYNKYSQESKENEIRYRLIK